METPAESTAAAQRPYPSKLTRPIASSGWWLLPLAILVLLILFQPGSDSGADRLVNFEARNCSDELASEWRPVGRRFSAWGTCAQLRTRIDLPDGMPLDAGLLLFHIHEDVAVFVNGVQIRNIARDGPVSYRLHPMLVRVGSGLLRPGSNDLRLDLHSASRRDAFVYILGVRFGHYDALEQWHERFLMLQYDGVRLMLVVAIAILLFLIPISIIRSEEVRYRWFALGLAGLCVYFSYFVLRWLPLATRWWETLIHAGLVLALWALGRFSTLSLGRTSPRHQQWLALFALAMLLGFRTFLFPPHIELVFNVLLRLALLALLIDLMLLWWRGRHHDLRPNGRWFAGALALVLLLGVSDSLRDLMRERWLAQAYLLHFGTLYLVLLMFVALLVRILSGLRDAELGQIRLAAALKLRSRDLEQEFERRREAEAAQTLAEERQRIMRDMHEGVGGQLVDLISRVQTAALPPAQLTQQLRGLLEALRLMIDSLDAACADLSVALGMFRTRMEPLVASSGVSVRWQTAMLPDLPPVPPATVLQVLRILHQALGNALRRTAVGEIVITASWDGRNLLIEVCDDGRRAADGDGSEEGCCQMQARAAELGGSLSIHLQDCSSRVRLELPLPEPADSA